MISFTVMKSTSGDLGGRFHDQSQSAYCSGKQGGNYHELLSSTDIGCCWHQVLSQIVEEAVMNVLDKEQVSFFFS